MMIWNFSEEQENLFIDSNHYLTQKGYYEKNIAWDGNCYYRCLSF